MQEASWARVQRGTQEFPAWIVGLAAAGKAAEARGVAPYAALPAGAWLTTQAGNAEKPGGVCV